MKKKFVLTLALVLMVAVGLSAATPLEVSGTFKAGYDFTFATTNGIAPVNKGAEADMDAFVAITGDFWKVALSGTPVFDTTMAATGTIYLDKALAEQGMDMGDLALTITIGNKTTLGGLSAYTNTRDALNPLEMNSGVAAGYSASVQADYGTLVSVCVGSDIAALDTAKAFVISAKSMPVDGVTAAVGYTNMDTDSVDGSVAGSVAVDVAKLAGIEDFGLSVSAYDVYLFTPKANRLYLQLKGSYDTISAWTEYRILDTKVNDLKVSASYSGIENVGLSAYVELNDITKVVAASTKIGGGVNYTMGGVKYAVDTYFTTATDTFSIAPSVSISF